MMIGVAQVIGMKADLEVLLSARRLARKPRSRF